MIYIADFGTTAFFTGNSKKGQKKEFANRKSSQPEKDFRSFFWNAVPNLEQLADERFAHSSGTDLCADLKSAIPGLLRGFVPFLYLVLFKIQFVLGER